jgi:predicted PurR-regulated permease PerM
VVELVFPVRTIAALVLGGVATMWAIALLEPLRLLSYEVALALTLAALLLPGIEWLSGRIPRPLAVAITVLGGLATVAAVAVSSARDLSVQAGALATALASRLETIDPESSLGRFVARSDLGDRAVRGIRAVPNRLVLGIDDPVEGAQRLGKGVIVVVLALFALVSVPAMIRAVVGFSDDEARRTLLERVLRHGVGDASRFVLRNLGLGGVIGIAAWMIAVLADLPGPAALGAWAALASLVPLVGVIVGLLPLVALSWSHSPTSGLLTLAVTLALTAGAAVVRRRWVERPLHLGPLLTVVALAAGLRLAGPLGSLTLLFFMALGAAVLREFRREGNLSEPASAIDEFARNVSDRSETRPSALLPLWRTHSRRTAAQLPVTVAWQSVAVAGAMVLAVAAFGFLFSRIPSVTIWTTLGVVLGLALNPVVNRVCERFHCGRSTGIAVLCLMLVVVLTALTILAVPPLIDAVSSLPRELPDTISSLERLPVIGAPLRRQDLGPAARKLIEELPDRIADERPLSGILGRAGDALLGAWWTALIALGALLDGHRLLDHARKALPPRRRHAAEHVADLAYRSFGRYAAGSALVAVANGTFVTVVALALGIPLAPMLGAWATVANFIPQIGGLIGGTPLVILGFNESPMRGLIALGAFLIYQNIENHLIQPVVIGKAIRLSPFTTLVCVLAGGAVGGVVGALLATPLVGAVKLVVCDVLDGRREAAVEHGDDRAPGEDQDRDPGQVHARDPGKVGDEADDQGGDEVHETPAPGSAGVDEGAKGGSPAVGPPTAAVGPPTDTPPIPASAVEAPPLQAPTG